MWRVWVSFLPSPYSSGATGAEFKQRSRSFAHMASAYWTAVMDWLMKDDSPSDYNDGELANLMLLLLVYCP